jgi:hypothetical protein
MAARKKKSDLRVWCFVGAADLWAISAQEDGANLPADHAPWRPLKSVVLTGAEPDEKEAQRLVVEQGFCCFKAPPADGGEQGADLG